MSDADDIIRDLMERHGMLTREQFWELLDEEERAFFEELNEQMGPIQFLSARRLH